MPTACDLAIIALSIPSLQPRHGVAAAARSASQVTAQAAVPFGWEDISIPSVITAFIISILSEANGQSDYRRRKTKTENRSRAALSQLSSGRQTSWVGSINRRVRAKLQTAARRLNGCIGVEVTSNPNRMSLTTH